MKIINASTNYLDSKGLTPYQFMERVGRICYKSEDKITDESAVKFIGVLAKNKHTAMLEHSHIYLDLDEMTISEIASSLYLDAMNISLHNITPVSNYLNFTNDGIVHIMSGSFRAFITLFETEELKNVRAILFIRNKLHSIYPEVFEELSKEELDILSETDEFTKNEYVSAYTRDEFIEFVNRTFETDVANLIFYKHLTHTIIFTCDRGVTHEFVRHRPASFAQESTRYCNYSHNKFDGEITFIKPLFFDEDTKAYELWEDAVNYAESKYFDLLSSGAKPEQARSVLPNSVKTEIAITTTESEWQHIINLRFHGTTGSPHPQMVEVMNMAMPDLLKNSNNRLK